MLRTDRVASLALIAALGIAGLTACGAARETPSSAGGCSAGITDTAVKVGSSSMQSGPGAAYKPMVDASRLVFDDVNEAGGVKMGDGRTREIEFTSLDDAYDPARSLINVKKLVEQEHVAVLFQNTGTSPILAQLDYTTEAEIPLLFSITGSDTLAAQFRDGALIANSQLPTNGDEARAIINAISQRNTDAQVAALYANNDAGKVGFEAVRSYAEEFGVRIIASESYEDNAPSVDSQITALRASGADTVLILGAGSLVTSALKKISELNWVPEKWVISAANDAVSVVQPAGPGAGENLHSLGWIALNTMVGVEDVSGVTEFVEWAEEHNVDPDNGFSAIGYLQARMFVEVLEATEGCTSEDIFAAARTTPLDSSMALPGVEFGPGESNPSYVSSVAVMSYDETARNWAPGDVIQLEDKGNE